MSTDTKYRTKEELRQRLEQLWKEAQLRQAERLRKQQAEGTIERPESHDDNSVDIGKAKLVWKEYQENHDVSDLIGKVVGIDPITERVWFGNSLLDVVAQRDADGIDSLLLFERVGYRACFVKRWRCLTSTMALRSILLGGPVDHSTSSTGTIVKNRTSSSSSE